MNEDSEYYIVEQLDTDDCQIVGIATYQQAKQLVEENPQFYADKATGIYFRDSNGSEELKAVWADGFWLEREVE